MPFSLTLSCVVAPGRWYSLPSCGTLRDIRNSSPDADEMLQRSKIRLRWRLCVRPERAPAHLLRWPVGPPPRDRCIAAMYINASPPDRTYPCQSNSHDPLAAALPKV